MAFSRFLILAIILNFYGAFAQEICNDSIDNDGDGLYDCADPECTDVNCDKAFPCNPNTSFYQVINGNQLVQYVNDGDPNTPPFINIGSVNSATINALAYNVLDGYMYGITHGTGSSILYRVESDGVFIPLGAIGLPTPTGGYVSGTFDLSGNYYVADNSTPQKFHIIDITNLTFTSFSLSNGSFDFADFTYLPSTGFIYALNNSNGVLIQISTTGNVTNLGAVTPALASCVGYGAAYSDDAGFIYFFCNNTGSLFKINPSVSPPTAELVDETNTSMVINDGASCPLGNFAPVSDLSITKTANQMAANVGSTITFIIEVTNDGPNETSDVVVQDLLQSGFQYTGSSASQGSYNNATGIWTVGNLPNNESAELTITATVLTNGNYFNQAQITNSSSDDPDSDPDTGFNTDDLNDNIADDDEAVVTIDVNHPPIANPDQFSTDEDNSLSFTILPNDSDVDGNLDPTTTNITCGLCSGAGNGTVTNNGNGNFTYVPNNGFTGTDNFIYQICDDMGLCDTALVTITINATQSCTETCEAIFAVNDVCVDETFTLNAAASTSCSASNIISYTWDFGDGNTSSSAIDSHVYTLPGNYDILLIIENDSNCIDSLTLSIEAKPLPTVNLSAFNDLCETSSPITLNQGSPAGGVYSGTGVVGNTFNPAMAGVGNHIITYVFTNNVGCSNEASNTIVVYPAYSILQPTIQNCDSVIVNGNWYSTSQTVIDTLASYHLCDSLVITPIIIEDVIMANQTAVKGCDSLLYLGNWYTSSTTVNDTSISSTGCDSISITPIIISSDQFIIAPEITTCDSVNINGNWYSSSQLVTDTLLSFNSCDSIVATQVTLANETIVYQTAIEQCDSVLFMNNWYFSSIDVYDTLTAINGCDSINITPLIINQAVTANLNAFEDICINSNTLILTGESPSGGEFSGIGVSNNTFNPSVSGVGNFEIVYTYTDSNNCISSASQFISVNGIGNDTIEYVLCEEGETFNLPNGGTVNSPGTYTDTILSSNNCDSIVVVILESFNETCLDDCFLTAPSAFTPDNDGLNDIFYIIANCTYEFEKFDFRIYNRWGEEVFKSNDINNGWDGTYKNVDVPLDVYSFIVNYSYFENKIFYGIITVIR